MRVSATFVPPGVPVNPVGLGRQACINVFEYADRVRPCDGDDRIRVVAVTPNATSEVLAADSRNTVPPAGFQDYLVRVSISPGTPSEILREFIWSIFLANASRPPSNYTFNYYTPVNNSCGKGTLPAPDLLKQGVFDLQQSTFVIPDTQTVTGNVCFQVSSADVGRLLLYTESPWLPDRWDNGDPFQSQPPDQNAVWFALR
jgi:hypothetical protein